MKWISKHLKFAGHLGEFQFKRRLDAKASEALVEVGVATGQVVFDFGCGKGTYTIPAARLVGEGGRVYALDVNKKSLDKMEKKANRESLENITRIDSSSDKEIPIEGEAIDHVLLIDVLQNIGDKGALFGEVHRILKPHGLMTVYPMHLERTEIENLEISKRFSLEDRKYEERILIFRKI